MRVIIVSAVLKNVKKSVWCLHQAPKWLSFNESHAYASSSTCASVLP